MKKRKIIIKKRAAEEKIKDEEKITDSENIKGVSTFSNIDSTNVGDIKSESTKITEEMVNKIVSAIMSDKKVTINHNLSDNREFQPSITVEPASVELKPQIIVQPTPYEIRIPTQRIPPAEAANVSVVNKIEVEVTHVLFVLYMICFISASMVGVLVWLSLTLSNLL